MANQEKLKSLIDKINWLYKSFQDNDFTNVSSLEKALIKEKVLMFYDEIENIETKVQKERFPSITSEKIDSLKEETNKEIIEEVEVAVVEETQDVEEPIEDSVVDEIEVVVEEALIEDPVVEETIVEKLIVEIPTEPVVEEIVKEKVIAPIIEEPAVVVSAEEALELKKAKFEKTVEFQRQIAMPKRDMREIIDLNKSFIFKAELFDQNNDIYNQFINEINSTRTEDEAFSFVVNWTEKMNWTTEDNKAYELLLRAIEKRFLPLI